MTEQQAKDILLLNAGTGTFSSATKQYKDAIALLGSNPYQGMNKSYAEVLISRQTLDLGPLDQKTAKFFASQGISTTILEATAEAKNNLAKPDMREYMDATGATFKEASDVLYGSKKDTRDWASIMESLPKVTTTTTPTTTPTPTPTTPTTTTTQQSTDLPLTIPTLDTAQTDTNTVYQDFSSQMAAITAEMNTPKVVSSKVQGLGNIQGGGKTLAEADLDARRGNVAKAYLGARRLQIPLANKGVASNKVSALNVGTTKGLQI